MGFAGHEVRTTAADECVEAGTKRWTRRDRFVIHPAVRRPPVTGRPSTRSRRTWSDGTSRELKNYGLACDVHGQAQLAAARSRHQAPRLSDGESVGPVELYVLRTGCRDVELTRLCQCRVKEIPHPLDIRRVKVYFKSLLV